MRAFAAIVLVAASAHLACGQGDNPVYTDDSPAARDTLDRLFELVKSGNLSQGVRSIQKLLDEEGERTLGAAGDPALYHSVRHAVHQRVLDEPAVLERYREMQEASARRLLDTVGPEAVEESYLLTSAGFEAALRVAQTHLEHARFEAARLTLEQLERHPDRAERGAAAADLMALVALYLDRDDVWDRAARWAEEAGAEAPERTPTARPPAADAMWRWAFEPIDEAKLPAAPRRPLWSSSLAPEEAMQHASPVRMPSAPNEVLWIIPSAGDDAVYTNDGVWITSWDRYTLEMRWRVRPPTDADPLLNDDITDDRLDPRSFGSRIEDPSTVTVAGPTVIATTGFATNGMREGDPRIHALDAATGELRWTVLLQRLHSSLDQSIPVGAALVDGDTVVVAARKSVPGRRIITLSMLGLDLHTGELAWVRPIASAGALPYVGRNEGNSDGASMHEGVMIRMDKLGVIAAVEAVTGRPRWIRTMPPTGFATNRRGAVYENNLPVVHDGLVYIRSADRRQIMAIDLDTGQLVHARSAGQFGSPRYLLAVGDHLAAVGPKLIRFIRFDEFESAAPSGGVEFDGQGVHGRAIAMGGRVVAPTDQGLVVVEPERREGRLVVLDKPGSPLPLGAALVVVDDMEIHSYLDWSVAERLLRDRMDEDPDDPAPAITYAELAFRAGRASLTPDAAGKALAAIRRRPTDPDARAAQQRLFEALRTMIDLSHDAWESDDPTDIVIRDLDVMEAIVARLAQAADGPEQRAIALLVEGRLRTSMIEPQRALEAYQTILADASLASQAWVADEQAISSGHEAARRIRALVLEYGPTPYAPFEAEASRRAAALPANAAPELLEAAARQYPGAAVSTTLWRRAADTYARADRPADELRCINNGLLTARLVYEAGVDPDPLPLSRAVVSQIDALRARGRFASAAHALHRFNADHPDLDLDAVDRSIDDMRRSLAASLSAVDAPAVVGDELTGAVQTLPGWELMSPVLHGATPPPGLDHVMLMSAKRVALFGDVGVDDVAGRSRLIELWSRPVDQHAPDLIRCDPDVVYLAWRHRRGMRIECVDAVTGRTRWMSAPFQDLFDVDQRFDQMLGSPASRFRTPRRRDVHMSETLLTNDSGAMIIIERSGRVAAIDEEDGSLLWNQRSTINQVFEADAAGGTLLIAGDAVENEGRPGAERRQESIHALDARTGREIAFIDDLPAQADWIRVADRGAVVHTGRGLHAYDFESGQRLWSVRDDPALAALAGWAFDDDLYVIDTSRALWHVSIDEGRLTPVPITTSDHLAGARQIDLVRLGDRVGVLSSGGVLLVEGDRLVAADGLDAVNGVLQPAATQQRIIAIEITRRQDDELRPLHMLHVLERDTLKLRETNVLTNFWDNPRSMTVVNAHVVVSSGPMTFVFATTPPARD